MIDSQCQTPIAALLTANAVSLVGNVLTSLAVPWFVLQTTGSAAQMGVTAFFGALPTIISSFLGGVLVDRLGFRRMSIIADLTSSVAVAALPVLYHTVGLAFWQLLALVFLRGLCNAPGDTARQALLPDLSALAKMRLERATGTFEAIQRGSVLLGAPLAGILIGLFSPSNVLWVDAASFLVSAALVAFLVPDLIVPAAEEPADRYLAQVTKGLRYIWTDRLIRAIIGTVVITNLLDAALGSVVIPVYVKRVFGSAVDLGLISGAFGAGAVIGTMLFLAYGHRLPRRAGIILVFTLVGTRAWILALDPPLYVILGAMVVLGLAIAPINPLLNTAIYQRIPAEMRARALGTLTAGVWAGIPIGGLLGGYLIAAIGLRPTLFVIGTCYVLATLSLLINPASRELDTPGEERQPARAPISS